MKEFATAKMDSWTKTITITVATLFVIIGAIAYFQNILLLRVLSVMGIVIFVISYLSIPKIEVDEAHLSIKNAYRHDKISFSDIKSVELQTQKKINIRIFGIGGIFGHFGYFNAGEIWNVTHIHKKIRIKTRKKTFVISPENTKEFLLNLQQPLLLSKQ